MKKPYQILIVDDHPMVASGTKAALEQMNNIRIIGIAPTGEACMKYVTEYTPDLVLLDYNLPDQNGYELTKQILAFNSDIQVIIFTGMPYTTMYNELLDIDVSGIVSKESSEEQLRNVVKCIMYGQVVIPMSIFKQLRLHRLGTGQGGLTEQETFIMSLVVEGKPHEQIGELLFTSKRSIDNYLKKIYEKLGAQNRSQAIQKFTQHGLHEHAR